MPQRLARLVTITYGDGDIEQYENITVEEHVASRHAEPVSKYKTLTVTDNSLISRRGPVVAGG